MRANSVVPDFSLPTQKNTVMFRPLVFNGEPSAMSVSMGVFIR
jgi:hypothetical protein